MRCWGSFPSISPKRNLNRAAPFPAFLPIMGKAFFLFFIAAWTAAAAPAQVILVGPLTPEAILEKIPEWKPFVDGYSPRLDIVSRLQEVPEVVQVEIFLGTWCPDCRQHVSAYIKLMDMVRNPRC